MGFKIRVTLMAISILFSFFLASLPPLLLIKYYFNKVGIEIFSITIAPISIIMYAIFILFLSPLLSLTRHTMPKIKEGVYGYMSEEYKYFLMRETPYYMLKKLLFIFNGVSNYSIFYKLFGTKIGKNNLICGDIANPEYIEIGNNVIIGDRALIIPHIIQRDKIIIKKIKIGNNCTIGARAVVFPGVKMEDNSIIGANTTVTKNKIVPKNTIIIGAKNKKLINKKSK